MVDFLGPTMITVSAQSYEPDPSAIDFSAPPVVYDDGAVAWPSVTAEAVMYDGYLVMDPDTCTPMTVEQARVIGLLPPEETR